MTETEKQEIANIVNKAVEQGVIKAVKIIFNDKAKLAELIEDIGMTNAIKQNRTNTLVEENDVLEILDNV